MTLLNILILAGVSGDTRRYRSLHLAEQSQMAGMEVSLAHVWQAGLPQLVHGQVYDVAVFQRVELDSTTLRILRVLKDKGTICLYDTDDLVFDEFAFDYIDSPDFVDPIRASLYRKSMRRQRAMLDACDAAITSTDFLAEQIKVLGKKAFVHYNAASLPMLRYAQKALEKIKAQSGQVIIGYASGTPTHDRDFAVAAPAIKQILVNYPNTQLWLAGEVDPGSGWENYTGRLRCFLKMPWQELPNYLASLDINLAPLVAGNPFSESKSAIKYMEAGLVKCPTIASNFAAFPQSIRHGENGLLAGNSMEWFECLAQLVENAEQRKTLGAQAYADVMRDDHPNLRSQQWQSLISEAVHLPGVKRFDNTGKSQDLTKDELIPDATYTNFEEIPVPGAAQRAWVTLWRRGPLELLGNIWVGLRRWLQFIFPFSRHGD